MLRTTDRLRTLRVSDVMNRQLVEISPDQTLEQVAQVFAAKDVSSAPVIDAQRRCVGILSATDFLKHRSTDTAVDAAMSKGVLAVAGHEPLLKAAQIMCGKHIHRLPVLGEANRVIGVISTMDIVAAVLNALDEETAAEFVSTDS